ncbi:TolB-like translocation protein [Maribacter antarcticus]|uniref:PD40 domain-containing protein n=1 Tax=Maribacter antarcticus TaxID=505250 RepID=UPI000A434695|nr:PD40 domain-containing protein [Maribacter antarcticus]
MFPNSDFEIWAVGMTITQDGNTMFFLGINPENQVDRASPDIYTSKKIKGKWQLPTRVGEPITTDEYLESYPTVVADGSLYFTSNRPGGVSKMDIYRAQYLRAGKFDTPVSIGPVVNSELGSGDTFVSSDESYLSKRAEAAGMYVSFKKNDAWQTPVYLSELINTK